MVLISDRLLGPSGLSAAWPASRATARGAVRPRAFSSSTSSGRHSRPCLCLLARAGSCIDGRGYAGIGHRRPLLCCSAPRPASAVDPARQPPLFLSFSPRPVQYRLAWLAMARRAFGPGGVGTGTALGTLLGTHKPLCFLGLRQSSHCSHFGRAHVIRSRAHAHRNVSLSLGTWEQGCISYVEQWLGVFLRRFPACPAPGTWEQAKAPPASPDSLRGAWNKIEAGYADLRCSAGDALGKFWAGDRVQGGLGLVGGQLRGLGGRNGGFPPFLGGRFGHVGTIDVGTIAKGVQDQRSSAAEQKLGRLTGRAEGDPPTGLERVQAGAIAAELATSAGLDRPAATPGPPARGSAIPGTLALTFVRISIETAFAAEAVHPSGLISDRLSSAGSERPQIWQLAKGAGGNFGAARRLGGPRSVSPDLLGERAGVNSPPAGLQAPACGGFVTLGPAFARVNSGRGAPA